MMMYMYIVQACYYIVIAMHLVWLFISLCNGDMSGGRTKADLIRSVVLRNDSSVYTGVGYYLVGVPYPHVFGML